VQLSAAECEPDDSALEERIKFVNMPWGGVDAEGVLDKREDNPEHRVIGFIYGPDDEHRMAYRASLGRASRTI